MRSVLTIAAKDLRQRLRDRSRPHPGVVVPFGLAFILNATLSGVTDASSPWTTRSTTTTKVPSPTDSGRS